jgi:hypothetical protein
MTYVPKRTWLGDLGQSLRQCFRTMMTPVTACVVAASLLSGCALTGAKLETPTAISHQHQVSLDQAQQLLESRGDPLELARLLRHSPHASRIEWVLENMDHPDQALEILKAKMRDPAARADLASLDNLHQVLWLLQMETDTKNYATPALGIFIDDSVATLTEHGGKWDEDKNRAFTVDRLGPNGSIDVLLFCPVSGHAEDTYPDALYQQHTSHQSAPASKLQRMRANAQIYSHNNSQYVYLTDDPTSYEMGKIVVADVKANGRYVTPVRVHLEGLEPGKTYEVRWSPFVGSDPNHPVVTHHGFKNGRSFRLIVPSTVASR